MAHAKKIPSVDAHTSNRAQWNWLINHVSEQAYGGATHYVEMVCQWVFELNQSITAFNLLCRKRDLMPLPTVQGNLGGQAIRNAEDAEENVCGRLFDVVTNSDFHDTFSSWNTHSTLGNTQENVKNARRQLAAIHLECYTRLRDKVRQVLRSKYTGTIDWQLFRDCLYQIAPKR